MRAKKRQATKEGGNHVKAKAVQPAPVPPSKLTFKQAVERLLTLGRKKGYVTYEQINELLPPDATSPEKIEEVIGMLNERNVDISSNKIEEGEKAVIEEVKDIDIKKEKGVDEEKEVIE